MTTKGSRTNSILNNSSRRLTAALAGLLLTLSTGMTASAQQVGITGTVTSVAGAPLGGVAVRLVGADARTLTNANGRYSITAPANGTLSFALIGKRPFSTPIAGRTRIDVKMDQLALLDEVLVTAYTEQRRADITGAVASVNIDAANRQTGASVLSKLDATVPGVTVAASGSPGARSTVRIRGVSSFQNNDPLYIVDGTPVQDSFLNFLNPDDITSIQVLKDASAASIYGSRASNGVVLIETTRKGAAGPPRATVRVRTGYAAPVRGYDDFLITNSLDYFQVVKAAYVNAGLPVPTNIYGDPNNPTVPVYTFAEKGTVVAKDAYGRPVQVDPSKYSYPNSLIMPGSDGTNWWKAVFHPARVADYNVDVNGGGEESQYGVSFNYFDQGGTARYNQFQRSSVRVNTAFKRSNVNFGENVSLSLARNYGGLTDDNIGEGGFLGKNILMQPVVPVYDINGNFASGKATGLGNNTNPLKSAYEARNNVNNNNQVFGNVFASLDVTPKLIFRTSLGFNLRQGEFSGFNPITPENAEAQFTNSIFENASETTEFTFTNTGRYAKTVGGSTFDFLAGQEVIGSKTRFLQGSISNLLSSELDSRFIQDALGDAKTKDVFSSGSKSGLLGFFGKVGYNYLDKYVASVTVREDGSSRLSPNHRFGTFPAFGLGWRISSEPFLMNNRILSDVMLRYGIGVTGNQAIPSGRIVSQFGGSRGDTYYDIGGTNTNILAGFRQSSLGNPELKWEEVRSQNLGADISLYGGAVNVIVDGYTKRSSNVLFNPSIPGTAGFAAAPFVNIASVQNRGFDFSIGHTGPVWSATFQGGHNSNKILSIDGVQDFFEGPVSTRFGNQVRNQLGYPIGSFFGYQSEGFFRDAADVAAHAKQDGAAPGRIKFKDVNGDGVINNDDRTIIGKPDPDFTAGLDLGYRRGNWDMSATVFGTFGNDIFDAQKEYYDFRNFETTVRKDLVENSWRPDNLNAKYPRIDQNDNFSHAISSYYIEDGSYVRLRNLQVGYSLPQTMAKWTAATRVYVQAENLFTRTKYTGLDPALSVANVTGSGGDIRDQYRGVDRGNYPSNRTFSLGIVAGF